MSAYDMSALAHRKIRYRTREPSTCVHGLQKRIPENGYHW